MLQAHYMRMMTCYIKFHWFIISDPCSVAHCGHQAICLPPLPPADDSTKKLINTLEKLNIKLKGIQNISDIAVSTKDEDKAEEVKESSKATCVCKRGFKGNPFERCYPQKVPNGWIELWESFTGKLKVRLIKSCVYLNFF